MKTEAQIRECLRKHIEILVELSQEWNKEVQQQNADKDYSIYLRGKISREDHVISELNWILDIYPDDGKQEKEQKEV